MRELGVWLVDTSIVALYDDGKKDLDEWKCYNLDGSIKE
jgi:hypothetical protein